MRLACPWALLLSLPLLLALVAAWRRRPPAWVVPDTRHLQPQPRTERLRRVPLLLEALGALLLVLALSRPQRLQIAVQEERQAVNLMMVLDLSGSMAAVDLPASVPPEAAAGQPNRLECARRELSRFLRARPEDRVGLVVFARKPYPACPLTTDHDFLQAQLAGLSTDLLEDGTGLSGAIALAAVHLGATAAPRQVLILLTDGRDNVPAEQPPDRAAALAAARGVTVHVVGIGSAHAVLPVQTMTGVDYRPVETAIDEALLRAVAQAGGGVFVRAADPQTFRAAIRSLEATEKARYRQVVQARQQEWFGLFAAAALGALAAAFVAARTVCLALP